MNRHVKQFFFRGLIFGGFGPVVIGIVYLILGETMADFSPTGHEIFLAIVSTYLLAFLHAGASVFPQMEDWPLPKILLIHFSVLYSAYAGCYLINSWIPFRLWFLGIFTAAFVAVYVTVWLTVYLIVRSAGKKMNQAIK